MNTLHKFWVLGHQVTAAASSGEYDLVFLETPPNTPGPPPHVHQKYAEFFLVTEGEVEFLLNGERRVLNAGASVDIPPGSLHTYRNRTDRPSKMVNIHSPKGFVDFFKTVGVPLEEPHAQERSVAQEAIERVIAVSKGFDIEFQEAVAI